MRYRLTTQRIEPNPDYDADAVRESERKRNWNYGNEHPLAPALIESTVLTMEVSPEQFDEIRKSALGVAK